MAEWTPETEDLIPATKDWTTVEWTPAGSCPKSLGSPRLAGCEGLLEPQVLNWRRRACPNLKSRG
jgi:hypothetical protein